MDKLIDMLVVAVILALSSVFACAAPISPSVTDGHWVVEIKSAKTIPSNGSGTSIVQAKIAIYPYDPANALSLAGPGTPATLTWNCTTGTITASTQPIPTFLASFGSPINDPESIPAKMKDLVCPSPDVAVSKAPITDGHWWVVIKEAKATRSAMYGNKVVHVSLSYYASPAIKGPGTPASIDFNCAQGGVVQNSFAPPPNFVTAIGMADPNPVSLTSQIREQVCK